MYRERNNEILTRSSIINILTQCAYIENDNQKSNDYVMQQIVLTYTFIVWRLFQSSSFGGTGSYFQRFSVVGFDWEIKQFCDWVILHTNEIMSFFTNHQRFSGFLKQV